MLYQSYPAVFFWPAHQYNTLSVEKFEKLWVETDLSGVKFSLLALKHPEALLSKYLKQACESRIVYSFVFPIAKK